MTKKDKPYYAEIRITGFDNKRELVDALRDAVTTISLHRPTETESDIEVEIEEFTGVQDLEVFDGGWKHVKLPKRLRKVIDHCFGSVKL